MTNAERHHVDRVRALGCVVRRRGGDCDGRIEIHHIAAGSGERSEFSTAGLCTEHHRGNTGLHGMGVKAFCRCYRVPGETEYGLLVWVNEDLARADTT